MKNIISSIFLVFCFADLAVGAVVIPPLTGPVVDQVELISRSDARYLEQVLYDYNKVGKAQVQVLIVDSIGVESIESYSMQVVEKWKLGSAKADNGILFVIAYNQRQMRIEVGQGLEGALPDVVAKRIISDVVTPLFRVGKYSDGIVVGVAEILHQIDSEYAQGHLKESPMLAQKKPLLSFLVFFLLVVISILRFRVPGAVGRSSYHGGHWGGSWGGGGGFGGSSGGGWSGGGGGFSGGGASGGW